MATTIKKGTIKRKVNASDIEILHPETEASLVSYVPESGGLTATNVQDAIDEIVEKGVGVTGVKGNAEQNYRTGDVNLTPANLGIALDSWTYGDNTSNKNRIEIGSDRINVVTKDTQETITGVKTFQDYFYIGESSGYGTNVQLEAAQNSLDITITSSNLSSAIVLHTPQSGGTLATQTYVSNAINALDTSSNVAPAVVSGSGATQKITFKDISESNGIIAAGSNITNAVTYTDGAIDSLLETKLDKKTTSGQFVYTHNGSTQGEVSYGVEASGGSLVLRTSSGQIVVPETPAGNGYAASKKYVDDKITQGAEYLGTVSAATGSDSPQTKFSTAGVGDWCRATAQFTFYDVSTGADTTVHVGDILINTNATVSASTWDVIHTEVDSDTNTQYQAIVGAAGTGYAGAIKLQSKELGGSFADQDTIKFIQGTNVTITPDTTNKTLTIAHATPTGAAITTSGFYKFSTDSFGHVNGTTSVALSDLTGLGAADNSKVVHLGTAASPSNETIYGYKTFNNPLTIDNYSEEDGNALVIKYNPVYSAIAIYGSNSTTAHPYEIDVENASPSATRTLTLPDDSGTFALTKQIPSVSLTTTIGSEAISVTPPGGSASSLTLVTRDTAQTITGQKTFSKSYNNSGITFTDTAAITGSGIYIHSAGNGSNPAGDGPGITLDGSNRHLTIKATNNVFKITGDDGDAIVFEKIVGAVGSQTTYTYSLPNATGTIALDSTIPNSVVSGKKSDGTTDITSTVSSRTFTLGDSGITAGTYSAIQVNAKGIAIAGGQILDVISNGGTPNVVNGGWYFEENA